MQSEREYLLGQLTEIDSHTVHNIVIDNTQFQVRVKHDLSLTMLDGKAVTAFTDTKSTQEL